ncbi:hypothetical protein [Haloglomus halophilum]|uniref:hypothetical protein n=1 Tax=Haloglomus halophilum TaxID=2962672 RepID=UPI0020CA06EA|nr:hypothetical protein [Haloglomus halophilum]
MSRTKGPVTRISIPSDEEYQWLDAIREDLGLTWRGMMLKAEQRLLAAERTWPAEFQTPRNTILVEPDSEADTDSASSSLEDEAEGTEGSA